MSDVLIRPLISEKMAGLTQKLNRYGFVVANNANKIQVKTAVEKMYGVTVKSVSTLVNPGKMKSRNTKAGVTRGQKGYMKKAYVTLAVGETIDFYSNI